MSSDGFMVVGALALGWAIGVGTERRRRSQLMTRQEAEVQVSRARLEKARKRVPGLSVQHDPEYYEDALERERRRLPVITATF